MTKKVTFTEFKELADYFLSVMDGDTHLIEDAYALLRKHGIVDEDGFVIGDDDDDDEDE